jgi:hypothetical protein
MARVFETAQNTLDWAKEALNELRDSFTTFLKQPGVGEFVTEFDPQTEVNEFSSGFSRHCRPWSLGGVPKRW